MRSIIIPGQKSPHVKFHDISNPAAKHCTCTYRWQGAEEGPPSSIIGHRAATSALSAKACQCCAWKYSYFIDIVLVVPSSYTTKLVKSTVELHECHFLLSSKAASAICFQSYNAGLMKKPKNDIHTREILAFFFVHYICFIAACSFPLWSLSSWPLFPLNPLHRPRRQQRSLSRSEHLFIHKKWRGRKRGRKALPNCRQAAVVNPQPQNLIEIWDRSEDFIFACCISIQSTFWTSLKAKSSIVCMLISWLLPCLSDLQGLAAGLWQQKPKVTFS